MSSKIEMNDAARRIQEECKKRWPDEDNLIHEDTKLLVDYIPNLVEQSTILAEIGLMLETKGLVHFTNANGIKSIIDDLEQQVARLTQDKHRLDWLQNNFYHSEIDKTDAALHPNMWAWKFYAPVEVQVHVRDVIDAARLKEQESINVKK